MLLLSSPICEDDPQFHNSLGGGFRVIIQNFFFWIWRTITKIGWVSTHRVQTLRSVNFEPYPSIARPQFRFQLDHVLFWMHQSISTHQLVEWSVYAPSVETSMGTGWIWLVIPPPNDYIGQLTRWGCTSRKMKNRLEKLGYTFPYTSIAMENRYSKFLIGKST